VGFLAIFVLFSIPEITFEKGLQKCYTLVVPKEENSFEDNLGREAAVYVLSGIAAAAASVSRSVCEITKEEKALPWPRFPFGAARRKIKMVEKKEAVCAWLPFS
jgi:hypothetical protein